MKTKVKAVLVMIAVGSALAVPFGASASHTCKGTVFEVVVLEGEPGGTHLYLEERGDDGIWTYSESNGVPGLQRGGKHAVLGYTDGCNEHNGGTADTLIF